MSHDKALYKSTYTLLYFTYNRLATTKIGRKLGALPHFSGGELGTHLAQCVLDRGPPPCQVPSWSIQPFGHNRHRTKIGGSAPFSGRGGTGFPSNTKSPGPRPTSIPSGILTHPVIWPQQIWAKNWRLCPFWERVLGLHLTQCGRGRGLPACQVPSWSLQPFDTTVHKRHRQTGQDRQDRQRSDSIGRAVLQTVAKNQKRCLQEWTASLKLSGILLQMFSGSWDGRQCQTKVGQKVEWLLWRWLVKHRH